MNCEGELDLAEWAQCIQDPILEPVMLAVGLVVTVAVGLSIMIFAARWAQKAIRGI